MLRLFSGAFLWLFFLTLPHSLCQSQLICNECKSVTAQVVMILFYNIDSHKQILFFFYQPEQEKGKEGKSDSLRGAKTGEGHLRFHQQNQAISAILEMNKFYSSCSHLPYHSPSPLVVNKETYKRLYHHHQPSPTHHYSLCHNQNTLQPSLSSHLIFPIHYSTSSHSSTPRVLHPPPTHVLLCRSFLYPVTLPLTFSLPLHCPNYFPLYPPLPTVLTISHQLQ